jgi:HAD superfamily hydrolase (TIGR01549 family)
MPAEAIFSGGIDFSRVRGLLFDVDGTLSDTDDLMVQELTGFLTPLSWLLKNRDTQTLARRLVMFSETPANLAYNLADRLGLDAVIASVYNWLARRNPEKPLDDDAYRLIPGVKEMLELLAGRYPMAVVSARDARSTWRFLENFNLLPFFNTIVTSQTCKHTKPFPDPVEHAAEQLGLVPADCVMIGDTIVDVRSGKAAGSQTIAVLCGFGTQRELKRAGADLILASTSDVLDFLTA